ncbi:MAG: DUF416 family protein [Cyanobacteria bacterium FC1]|nr:MULTISPECIES: DUF416 family protein [Desertifilum]MDA0209901.1 DUF416 family protein [Cyanobacteria bacterium FC1]MDI9635477.1 DUF416 family protein [Geitlerinema splendidum]
MFDLNKYENARIFMYWDLSLKKLDDLKKELESLPTLHRVAFAASICERLLPNHKAFCREKTWGNPTTLRAALDEVWQILEGKPLDAKVIRQLVADCEDAIPDSDYGGPYVYPAQQTALAIRLTLEACLTPTPQCIAKVAICAGDILFEWFFAEMDDVDPSWCDEKSVDEQMEDVASHPFGIREIAKEIEDLQQLKNTETLNRNFLEWLRISSYNDGKSLIDLS